MVKLRFLTWGDYPGFSRWAQFYHKGGSKVREVGEVTMEAEVRERERLEDDMLLALKIKRP